MNKRARFLAEMRNNQCMAERESINEAMLGVGISRRDFTKSLIAFLAPGALIRALGQSLPSAGMSQSNIPKPGSIIYVDSGDAIKGGIIIAVDPVTHEQTELAAGKLLRTPFAPLLDAQGDLIVSDSG